MQRTRTTPPPLLRSSRRTRIYLTDRGPIKGRQAIEKMYADLFQKLHFSDHVITVDQDSPRIIGTDGKEMWATGGWSSTIQVQNSDPVQIKGYWSVIRGGDDLKIRMLSPYVTPADAKPSRPQLQLTNNILGAAVWQIHAVEKVVRTELGVLCTRVCVLELVELRNTCVAWSWT